MNLSSLFVNIYDILNQHIDTLNQINVFPVADKDTGSNLVKTIQSCCKGVSSIDEAMSVMIGSARGSSGNIIALYLMGLNNNYSKNFYDMCTRASQFTWDTISGPVEGTILTAMKDVPEKYDSVEDFVYQYIQNTEKNLMKGPDLLPVLKENNTVDSGTLGFLYILCGVYKELTGKDVTPNLDISPVNTSVKVDDLQYCIEFALQSLRLSELKESLLPLGNELICISNNNLIKVHIHSDDYSKVLREAIQFGELQNVKVEDMKNGNTSVE